MRTPTEPACWRLDACSEASASYHASASSPRYRLAENVGFVAVVVAELKFSQVERQILLADMVEAAHDTALEERPERFEIVGVNLAANVLASTMADGFMWEVFFQEAIAGMFVCRHQVDRFADGFTDERIECDRIRVLDNLADH